ncbi:ZPR1 zinc finger domain-containing protein [Aeropyrum camini]|uniref:C4-type Zn-finger protein n=1 Tax=Aeropyrum camini SY1 = JCM 12091 TaxID=1198449 RepID=U3TFD7_9CREN|nr:ZPR1 zinc finger domain-containing protein [Aeropyrum camini]BAN90688.1 C4-type Zn-finger protein [Aeropyrum camini SY1 = JCM 12091]
MAGESPGGDVLERLIAESGKTPIKIAEVDNAVCPACGARAMKISEYLYSVPYFNNIIIGVGECRSCGYRYRDVRLAEATEPKKIIVTVKGEKQLRYLLAKSPLSAVYIPETGLEMIPGAVSVGFITTVEGILHRFHEVAQVACKEGVVDPEDLEKCKGVIKWIEEAIEGRRAFTLVICDFDGLSRVIGEPQYVREEDIDEKCSSLKPGFME